MIQNSATSLRAKPLLADGEITHVSLREVEPAGWVPLGFVSRTQGRYIHGFDPISPELRLERIPGLVALPTPLKADLSKILWLTDTGAVVYADEKDPFGDSSKIVAAEKLENCAASYDPRWGEKLVAERLDSADPAHLKELVVELTDELHFFQGSGVPRSPDEERRCQFFVETLNDLSLKLGLPPVTREHYTFYYEVGRAILAKLELPKAVSCDPAEK